MSTDNQLEELIDNPNIEDRLEWIKERLGLNTNEELFSKALTLLYQTIQLEDKGYHIGAWKDDMISKDVIRYQILPKK
jgi:hypothetical protein